MLNNIKIVEGNEGFKIIVDGYNYVNGCSIEILDCTFGIDEKEILEKIKRSSNGIDVNNPCFKTYKEAEEILKWLHSNDRYK